MLHASKGVRCGGCNNDHVKGIRCTVRQDGRDFQQLKERSRPAMGDDQGHRVWVFAAEMQLVDSEAINVPDAVWIGVQHTLLSNGNSAAS